MHFVREDMADYPKFSDFAKGEAKLDGEKVKNTTQPA